LQARFPAIGCGSERYDSRVAENNSARGVSRRERGAKVVFVVKGGERGAAG